MIADTFKMDQQYTPVTEIHRLYSKLDIVSMIDIKKEIEDNGKLKELDFQTMLTLHGNDTIFTEFAENEDYPKLDEIGNAVAESKHDKKDLRSLAYLL